MRTSGSGAAEGLVSQKQFRQEGKGKRERGASGTEEKREHDDA